MPASVAASRPLPNTARNNGRSPAAFSSLPQGQGAFANGTSGGTSAVPRTGSNTLVTTPTIREPAPTSMGGTVPFPRSLSSSSQDPAQVVRDMRRAERERAQIAMDTRVRRQSYLREAPSADASRELHRRNSSPGYMAARVIQGVDWNRDAFLSQQSYNHAMSEARKLEAGQVAEWNQRREGEWHADIGAATKVLEEKTMPQHCRGMIPVGSGAASKTEAGYLNEHAGSSFVPEQKATLHGRYRDENKLLRIFRSYDTTFNGAISFSSFRSACRYLGIEQAHGRHAVDELARRAGTDKGGNVLYQKAIDLLEILPQPGTETRDRQYTGAVVPQGMRPRPSDANPLVGPLGDVGYLATSPWGSASSEHAADGGKQALSKAMKSQLQPGPKTEDQIRALAAIGPIQEKLVGAGGDRMGAAVRLKAALRRADLDRDGCIGYQDFQRTLHSKLGINLSPHEMEQVSKHFDATGAGQIDYYQMSKALEASGEEESRRNAAYRRDVEQRERALAKLRDSVRGKVWKFEDTFKRLDLNGDGVVSGVELSVGLAKSGVLLTPEEDLAVRKWAGDGVEASEFIRALDRPIRAHQSHLGAGFMNTVEEDPYQGRGKRIVYQGSDGSDFQSQYDYLNSGFLTSDQRKEKMLMHSVVRDVRNNGLQVYVQGGGPIMQVFQHADPEGKGEVPRERFEECLDRLGIQGSVDGDGRKRLIQQFRGSSDGWVNYEEFFNVIKHEKNETMQRPHTSSQIGFSKGQLSSHTKKIEREKGKRIFSVKMEAADHARNTMLDHHDSFGRSGEAVDLAENLHTTWIPRTQEELNKVRKISDVLSAARDRLSSRFQTRDTQRRGIITNGDFIDSVRDECGHLLREEDIGWLADRVKDNATGVVKYSNVVDVMKDHSSLPTSRVNYGDAGIKISTTRHTEDRMVLSSLGAARIEKGIRVTQRAQPPKQNRRLDPWGKPLSLPTPERTYEQKRFETMGNLGGMRGGVVGMDPQIAAHLEKTSGPPKSTFGSGRGGNGLGGNDRSPSKVLRLRGGSPTKVSRRSMTQQNNSGFSPAFDRNTWRL